MPKIKYWLTFFCLSLFTTANSQADQSPYNVVFIAADDLNNHLGTYGHPYVKTPNLDRLAKRGVQFNAAYNQYPLCNPSRASIMTGLRPSTLAIYDLDTHFRDRFPAIVTLPQLFRNNGYTSVRLGKIYHYHVPAQIGTNGLDDPTSWDTVINPIGRDKMDEQLVTNLTPQRSLGAALAWQKAEGTAADQTDGKIAEEAVKMLYQLKDKPFFLAVGFFRPHTPFIAPASFFDLYPKEQLQLPDSIANDWADIPDAALFTKPAHWGLLPEQRKTAMQAYYAAVSMLDEQVGKLLDALDALDLTKKTIIVFWSDHGYHLGEHGQWLKQSLFEDVARVPLLMAGPGIKKAVHCDRTVELVGLYPTLASLCGLPAPDQLEGHSFVPLLSNPRQKWSQPAYTQIKRGAIFGKSVRTQRWRYTEWDEGKAGVELYDHKNDPREFYNLYDSLKSGSIVATLSRLLREEKRP
jgi:uncharacterized sulfatase